MTPGTIIATTNQTVTVDVTATSVVDGTKSATDPTITTVLVANLSVVKEVSKDGTAWSVASDCRTRHAALLPHHRHQQRRRQCNQRRDHRPADHLHRLFTGSGKRATGAASSYAAAPTTLTDTNGDGDGYDWNLTTANTVTYTVGNLPPGAASCGPAVLPGQRPLIDTTAGEHFPRRY